MSAPILDRSGPQPLRSSRSGSRQLRSSIAPVLGSSGHWLLWRSLPLWRSHGPVPALGVFRSSTTPVLDIFSSRLAQCWATRALGLCCFGLFDVRLPRCSAPPESHHSVTPAPRLSSALPLQCSMVFPALAISGAQPAFSECCKSIRSCFLIDYLSIGQWATIDNKE